eukprot:gb/GECG01001924.1/.p1 GENE.gb/GECG01001924.1/~~gb/GECG01001924.1/.p1  ORF type:complete len:1266 (+),score=203.80 gb/GECG01001924.1/:1-3798(+)
MSLPPDLESFPILDIQNVPYLSTQLLEQSRLQLEPLLASREFDGTPLASHAEQQLDVMRQELDKRIAEARVQALLTGDEETADRLKHSRYMTITTSRDERKPTTQAVRDDFKYSTGTTNTSQRKTEGSSQSSVQNINATTAEEGNTSVPVATPSEESSGGYPASSNQTAISTMASSHGPSSKPDQKSTKDSLETLWQHTVKKGKKSKRQGQAKRSRRSHLPSLENEKPDIHNSGFVIAATNKRKLNWSTSRKKKNKSDTVKRSNEQRSQKRDPRASIKYSQDSREEKTRSRPMSQRRPSSRNTDTSKEGDLSKKKQLPSSVNASTHTSEEDSIVEDEYARPKAEGGQQTTLTTETALAHNQVDTESDLIHANSQYPNEFGDESDHVRREIDSTEQAENQASSEEHSGRDVHDSTQREAGEVPDRGTDTFQESSELSQTADSVSNKSDSDSSVTNLERIEAGAGSNFQSEDLRNQEPSHSQPDPTDTPAAFVPLVETRSSVKETTRASDEDEQREASVEPPIAFEDSLSEKTSRSASMSDDGSSDRSMPSDGATEGRNNNLECTNTEQLTHCTQLSSAQVDMHISQNCKHTHVVQDTTVAEPSSRDRLREKLNELCSGACQKADDRLDRSRVCDNEEPTEVYEVSKDSGNHDCYSDFTASEAEAPANRTENTVDDSTTQSEQPEFAPIDYSDCFSEFQEIFVGCQGKYSKVGRVAAGGLANTSKQQGNDAGRLSAETLASEWIDMLQSYSSDSAPANEASHGLTGQVVDTLARFYLVRSSRYEVHTVVSKVMEAFPEWQPSPLPAISVGSEGAHSDNESLLWSLLWTWSKPNIRRSKLLAWQRVNHFQHAKELTRKDLLQRNLSRYQCLGGKFAAAFSLLPPTFVLPKEYVAFAEAFGKASFDTVKPNEQESFSARHRAAIAESRMALERRWQTANAETGPKSNLWILKPIGMSRGRGIRLIDNISQVGYSCTAVIQKYVDNPLLLEGFKFDLRIYVLVTSFSPLEAFIYDEGFARISSKAYDIDSEFTDKMMHLTNTSIQKDSDPYDWPPFLNDGDEQHVASTKCSLEFLWKKLTTMGIDSTKVWESICNLIVKSLVCADDVIPAQPTCFELFGYDVLIDRNLKAWLIEINSSPSMGIYSPLDERVKTELIRDTISLVDPLGFNTSELLKVLKRRLRRHKECKARPHMVSACSGLGSGQGRVIEEVDRKQLNQDLHKVLGGRKPRQYGEPPRHIGRYERLAPGSNAFNNVIALKYTIFRHKQEKK